ncbi:MAG: hypothetical protein ACFFCG_12110, partial [Promethearchaeota archaeon]
MHFLRELIETPILDDPAKKHMSVHRHFYRYSKGDFIGPALKVSKTSGKISLKGTHEYEDLILELVVRSLSNSQLDFEIKGRLITGSDLKETLSNLGLSWDLKRSTGQTKNYKSEIVDHINKSLLLKALEILREHSYLLLSFVINPSCKVSTKKNIPQPSKKKVEEDDVNKRIQFCTGILSNTSANLDMVLDLAASDFKSGIPKNWKSLTIFNNYKITEIELPTNTKDSRLLRIMAIRKGKMFRSIDIDGEF